MKVLKVKLTTANKTDDQIKARYDAEISQKEIENFKTAFDLVDGLEIGVIPSQFDEGSYVVVGWHKDNDHIMRDFVYHMEQDPYFGSYVDDREAFLEDWNNNEYEPAGSLSFEKEDIEVLEDNPHV
ncbi:hypothetical protein [Oceanobacillus kapialis]|uniref:Uncharacterized protein n=1 Tax=Oceanobacillus kapialis TaxID=481353 RepID=A0ABW5PZX5_9BACI